MTSVFILFQVVFAVILITIIVFPQIKPPLIVIQSNTGTILSIIGAGILVFLLFIYMNPILGIMAIIAFYVLFLRANEKIARIQHTQENINQELVKMDNVAKENTIDTLEEHIIGIMAPIIPPPVSDYYYTQFKPVNEPIGNASIL
jgi:hypothetical protein